MLFALPTSHTLSLPDNSAASKQLDARFSESASAVNSAMGCVDSTDILRGQKAVEISHNGLTYRLQATRLGKLILTK